MVYLKVCFAMVAACLMAVNAGVVDERRIYSEMEEVALRYPEVFWQAIVPGTKWCGDGDVAENDDDLGFFKETDTCCRDHDHCDDILPSGETKYNLTNDGSFTRLHCKCDHAFYECLKEANQPVSHIVGVGYFNGLGGMCFEENYPATCVKFESIIGFRKRCIEYSYDDSAPKLWQWFDVPRYIH